VAAGARASTNVTLARLIACAFQAYVAYQFSAGRW
jgi:hypothetical protein